MRPGMPTYLRWIAAVSTGITVQLIFTLVTYPLGGTTTTTEDGATVFQLSTLAAWVLPLANVLLAMLAALWVNDWIAKRYPRD